MTFHIKSTSALLLVSFLMCANVLAETGWLLGAGIGVSENADYNCSGCGSVTSLDDSGSTYKLFGGYRFHPNFALIAGYARLADTNASGPLPFSDKLEVDGLYIAGRGIAPLGDRFEASATVGSFRWDQTVTYNAISGSFDGNDLMYGLGLSYLFGRHDGGKLQVEWVRYTDVGTNDINLGHIDKYDAYTVNYIYQFK